MQEQAGAIMYRRPFGRAFSRGGGEAVSGKLCSRGKGALLAANPDNSGVPGMQILGSIVLAIVFPLEDRVKNIWVQAVHDLRYGFILGERFFQAKRSVISLDKGKDFQQWPGAPWVLF